MAQDVAGQEVLVPRGGMLSPGNTAITSCQRVSRQKRKKRKKKKSTPLAAVTNTDPHKFGCKYTVRRYLEGKKHLRVTLDMLMSYDESVKSDSVPIQTELCVTQLPQLRSLGSPSRQRATELTCLPGAKVSAMGCGEDSYEHELGPHMS